MWCHASVAEIPLLDRRYDTSSAHARRTGIALNLCKLTHTHTHHISGYGNITEIVSQKRAILGEKFWRVAGRESGSPELLESPRTSPEVPPTSLEVFRRLPRKFSHCGTEQQSRGSPEVSQTSPEVPRTSPEVSRTSPEVTPFFREA